MIKIKDWPIPRGDFERLFLMMKLLDWLPDSPYRIMIRYKEFQYVGLVDEMNLPIFDSGLGKKVGWFSGYKPNGGRKFSIVDFKEPRYQKIPNVGNIKDGVIDHNDMFLVIARNTGDLSDNIGNFTYVISQNDMFRYDSMLNHVEVLKTNIMDLEEKIRDTSFRAERSEMYAETLGRQLKEIRTRHSEVMSRNVDLEAQVARLLRVVKKLNIGNDVSEAKMDMEQENASETGRLLGMTPMQVIDNAADAIQEIMMKFDSLQTNNISAKAFSDFKDSVIKDVNDIKNIVKNISSNTQNISGKKVNNKQNEE